MKKLYINGTDTGFLVKHAEHAVYGAETAHLFERGEIEAINDAHDDAVYVNVYYPKDKV